MVNDLGGWRALRVLEGRAFRLAADVRKQLLGNDLAGLPNPWGKSGEEAR